MSLDAKNTDKNEEIRRTKKEEILGANEKKSIKPALIITGLVAVLAVVAIIWTISGSSPTPGAAGPDRKADAGVFSYPVSEFNDGKAKYYSMKTGNGLEVKFFILKSSDGVIRAAFDACDVCWRAGKGYAQDGDYMVCRNCGRRFASIRINEVKGGCNPAPLKREIKGDKLLITTSDILEGSRFFDFSS